MDAFMDFIFVSNTQEINSSVFQSTEDIVHCAMCKRRDQNRSSFSNKSLNDKHKICFS